MKKNFLLTTSFVLAVLFSFAQNVGIGTNTPNSSAALEIKASNRGLLIPRTSAASRLTIVSPAKGLMVYDTTTSSFWFHNGSSWVQIGASGNGWSLTGNAGTNPATNFIGTTDAQPLIFKVNNVKAGYLDYDPTTANTGFGYQALFSNGTGYDNTANGAYALYSNTTGSVNTAGGASALYSNTTGNNNTALGYHALGLNIVNNNNTAIGTNALYNNTADINTAIGLNALYSNTKGGYNTASGASALYSNTIGYQNTANGVSALYSNTTGVSNNATGVSALYSNTTGYQNTANGVGTLSSNTEGYDNTANGSFALESNIIGNGNTAIGFQALRSSTTGNGNTAIGSQANVSTGDLFGATAIGNSSITNANDKIVIGNTDNTSLTGGYGAWQSFSDGRFKENIQDNVPGLAFINKLHPITYHLNTEKIDEFLGIKQRLDSSKNAKHKEWYLKRSKEVSAQMQTGFIAQEVEATAKSIGYDFDGVHHPESDKDNYTLGYATFVVPLVKAVQELSTQNVALKQTITSLQQQIDELKKMILTSTK